MKLQEKEVPMKKKIALITGGSTGIGASVAEQLSEAGFLVVICDIKETLGINLAEKLSGHFIYCDVTDLSSVEKAAQTCIKKLGTPTFVHLNAGIMSVPTGAPFLAIEDLSVEQYRRIVGVNLDGVFHGLKTFLPKLEKQGGAITITASTAGLGVVPVDPMYTATKYAVIGMARAVAAANEKPDVRINVICPSVTDTQIVPEEYKRPEFNMMPANVMAAEIVDLLMNGSNGEVRVKVAADRPAFEAEMISIN